MRKTKTNNAAGITLIALVITIIVLLILASVTVANITGGEGTLEKASAAKQKSDISNAQEEVEVEAAKLQMHDGEYIVNALESKYSTNNKKGSATINVDVARNGDILEGALINIVTSDYKLTGTIYGTNGEIIWEEELLDNSVEGVPIPTGFVASEATGENTIEGGLVIYEGTTRVTNLNVEVARRTRDQYVWIPVKDAGLTYGKDTTFASKHSSNYTAYSDWTDAGINTASVNKYGGFFIGRYEAGWDEKVQDGTDFTTSKNTGNALNKKPQMKQGYAPWDYVSEDTAEKVSKNLYNSNVTSQVVDSAAWDTTMNWLISTGAITVNSNGTVTSTDYGNYVNSTFSVSNILYAPHRYYDTLTPNATVTATTTWVAAKKYKVGSFTSVKRDDNKLDESDNTNYVNEWIKPLFTLGATDKTKTNNIYDLAGNLWEWTSEKGYWGGASTAQRAVLRGGSFSSSGLYYPLVYRYGSYSAAGASFGFGFRVVLYVNP